jgi:hypothetical protein
LLIGVNAAENAPYAMTPLRMMAAKPISAVPVEVRTAASRTQRKLGN